jgi:hypothetical protein
MFVSLVVLSCIVYRKWQRLSDATRFRDVTNWRHIDVALGWCLLRCSSLVARRSTQSVVSDIYAVGNVNIYSVEYVVVGVEEKQHPRDLWRR